MKTFLFYIWLALIILGVYIAILSIKFLIRAIEALDIYIRKNRE